MGDRALIIVHNKTEIGPVVYLHWSGHRVAEILQETCSLMQDRKGDVSYASARLIGICHASIPGSHSLGCWNGPDTLDEAKTKDFSHGDAGVILVDVSNDHWQAECFNGYGLSFNDGKTPHVKQMMFTPQAPVKATAI